MCALMVQHRPAAADPYAHAVQKRAAATTTTFHHVHTSCMPRAHYMPSTCTLHACHVQESVLLLQHLPQDGELPEEQLLSNMARVQLPAAEYQTLLVDAIINR